MPEIGPQFRRSVLGTLIEKALGAAGGRISGPGGAAKLLGVKPTTLRSKIRRLGLDPRRHHDD